MTENGVKDLQNCIKILMILLFTGFIMMTGGYDGMKQQEAAVSDNIAESGLFFQNPLPISNIGDPYVIHAKDGNYYMYCTSASDGYYCWESPDLVNWNPKKTKCYTYGAASWADHNFWAPEVVEYKDKYYMYYTAAGPDISLRIGLAVSDFPQGPYVDIYDHPLFDFGYATIDANVFIDDDGKKYLYFVRDCSENEGSGIQKSEVYGIRLSDDMTGAEGEPAKLLSPEQPWEMASDDPIWNEGPEMIKHNGIYYLTYSGNYFGGRSYSVGYATAKSPLGPFKKAGENPILQAGSYESISGTGHHSMVYGPDGESLFFVYHSHTYPRVGGGNRQVNLDRACFDEQERLCVSGPTVSLQPVPEAGFIDHIEIACGGDAELPDLHNGLITVHKKDAEKRDTILKTDASGKVELNIKLEKETAVEAVLIYRGSTDFDHAELVFDGNIVFRDLSCPEEAEQRSLIALFEPIICEGITVTLYAEPESEISLSEIQLLSGEKTG